MIGRRISLMAVLFISFGLSGYAQIQPLTESVSSGAVSAGVLPLGLKDAVDRAIKNNLAAIYGTEAERVAAAQRLGDLADLLPKLEARLSGEQRQVNLAAFGFSGFPGIKPVIGPFALVDARASFTSPLVDLERRHNLRESSDSLRAAALKNLNTRELVAFTTVDLYLQIVSSESRVVAVEAQLVSAKTLFGRATDLKNAGYAPGIDVLRAEVEQRAMEYRLIQAKNNVQKQKLALAKAIGLPLGQEFLLTDRLPAEVQADLTLSQLIDRAYANRSDAKALDVQVHAAEEAVKAVKARRLPTLGALGDYGANGSSPLSSHGTYSLGVELRVPIFDKSIESDALEKEANLRQRQAERDSLHGRIEYDVRSSLLDLQSAAEEMEVARRSLLLAQQQLDQAQDRFGAGVTDNLEVVQAQETVALANEAAIESLYDFNISRASLARATGAVERSIQEIFGGSSSR